MLNLLKRWILWLKLYALDIHINDKTDALDVVGDPFLEVFIYNSREEDKAERAHLRAEYNATFPAGQRRTWAQA